MIKVFGRQLNKKSPKKRISVRVPQAMLEDVKKVMANEGVNQRFRSRWIADTIIRLVTMPNYLQIISEEWIDPGKNKVIQVSLEADAIEALYTITKELKEDSEQQKKDLHSTIVRTSIIQAILANEIKEGRKE